MKKIFLSVLILCMILSATVLSFGGQKDYPRICGCDCNADTKSELLTEK
ncbi:MAG: hypothetical protein ACLKAN_13900 [Alkaliphilus sp.]